MSKTKKHAEPMSNPMSGTMSSLTYQPEPKTNENIRFFNTFKHMSLPKHKKTLGLKHFRTSEDSKPQENPRFFNTFGYLSLPNHKKTQGFSILSDTGTSHITRKPKVFQYFRTSEPTKPQENLRLFNTFEHLSLRKQKKT